MPKIVKNPAIGHAVTFLQTSATTNGELLQIEYCVEQPETKAALPMHFHARCEERFEAVSGQIENHL